jgi:Ulp1 family protease
MVAKGRITRAIRAFLRHRRARRGSDTTPKQTPAEIVISSDSEDDGDERSTRQGPSASLSTPGRRVGSYTLTLEDELRVVTESAELNDTTINALLLGLATRFNRRTTRMSVQCVALNSHMLPGLFRDLNESLCIRAAVTNADSAAAHIAADLEDILRLDRKLASLQDSVPARSSGDGQWSYARTIQAKCAKWLSPLVHAASSARSHKDTLIALVPIHLDSAHHWSLLVVRLSRSLRSPDWEMTSFDFFDSMPGLVPAGHYEATARLVAAAFDFARGPRHHPTQRVPPPAITVRPALRQHNATDCGVYVVMHAAAALRVLRGASPPWWFHRGGGANAVRHFRRVTAQVLLDAADTP